MNNLYKITAKVLVFCLVQLLFTSCEDDETTPTVAEKTKFEGTWRVEKATLNGFDITSDYQGASIIISKGSNDSFHMNSNSDNFPITTQNFEFSSNDEKSIIFKISQVSATMEVDGDTMDLSFNLEDSPNSRTEGIDGDWGFEFSK